MGNAALALAINNHLSPPLTTLPPTSSFAVIITRDDASDVSNSDAAKAHKKKKETIRNVLIITLNPVTLFFVIWVVFCFVRGVNRHIRYLRQKQKADLEKLAVELEWRRQWEAHFGPGSSNYQPPPETPEKTMDDGKMPPRQGVFSRWPWSKQNPKTKSIPGVFIAGLIPAELTTVPLAEKAETYERASNDTDRTLKVDSASDCLAEDRKNEKKGVGS